MYKDDLKEIHNFLVNNGWIDLGYDCGEYISKDYKFKISVTYDTEKEKFLVRTAILPIFDRWANSGSDHYQNTVESCINFLKGKYATEAFKEINFMLEDEIDPVTEKINNDAYELMSKIIDSVTEWFEKE